MDDVAPFPTIHSAERMPTTAVAGPCLRLFLEPEGPQVDFLRAEIVVGRHSDADLCLRLPDVSRKHCRFVHEDSVWRLIDLNSTNGVYVNGERVAEKPLHHGDTVRVGSYVFRVNLETVGQVQIPAADAAAVTSLGLPMPNRLAS